jgi:pimeloyl-ACP methyl ester carboxylesterase
MAELSPPYRKYENHASRYVVVDGLRVHYRDEGQDKEKAPTLVLLHGVMASLHTWDGWVEALRPHYRIIRIDLPGFGFSDHVPADAYTPQASIARLHDLLMTLGVERFHLGGNSLGGLLSWYYAATHPERVERMVLVSPIAYPQKLPFIIGTVSGRIVGDIAKRITTPRFIVDQNVRMVYGDPTTIAPGVEDRYYELLQYGENRVAMVDTFRALRRFSSDASIAKRIRDVRAPTLIMWGDKDRWVPPALTDRWKADLQGVTIRMYPGLGHVAMEELPEVTARDAHAFLSGASAHAGHAVAAEERSERGTATGS